MPSLSHSFRTLFADTDMRLRVRLIGKAPTFFSEDGYADPDPDTEPWAIPCTRVLINLVIETPLKCYMGGFFNENKC